MGARRMCFLPLLSLVVTTAAAGQVVLTTDTVIGTSTAYDNRDLIVRGCTVTIDGPHTFLSLRTEADAQGFGTGIIKHTPGVMAGGVNGMSLHVLGNAQFGAGGIELTGCGWPANSGPPLSYDSYAHPNDFGAGGPNGAGGGAVRLIVDQTLTVDSVIAADGGITGDAGSIWIQAGRVEGLGYIETASPLNSGRIAIYTDDMALPLSHVLSAQNGAGNSVAGTIYIRRPSEPHGTLYIDGDGRNIGFGAPFTAAGTVNDDMVVRNGGIVGPRQGQTDFHLIVTGNLTIEATGAARGDSRGYAAGPGRGQLGAGAGYGGDGGDSATGAAGGSCYGSVEMPTDLGSGTSGNSTFGGGAMRITVGGTLTADGPITCDGHDSTIAASGGSIWITAGTLAGSGLIAARGGVSNSGVTGPGGGGGGRIALYYDALSYTGTVSAVGSGNAAGMTRGGAGSIYRKLTGSRATVVFDNGGIEGSVSGLPGPTVLDADVVVRNGAVVGPDRLQTNFDLTVTGDLTVEGGPVPGRVSADGRGDTNGGGVGEGFGGPTGSGAGHGGRGGQGASGAAAGQPFDSATQPTQLGSSGGNASGVSNSGGAGGGVIGLTVTGTLTVDGTLSANAASPLLHGGGGSGGSIRLSASTLAGIGQISANGSAGDSGGGGGGGGRIAIRPVCVQQLLFDATHVTALGGGATAGGQPGHDGTLWWPSHCLGDFNADGQLTPADVAIFVNTWFASLSSHALAADVDCDGAITPADMATFVNAWFAALAAGGC